MEKEIATMEAQQHIDKIEKIKMASELRTKQALIDIQEEELSKIRLDFAEKCKEADDNKEKFEKILEGLDRKVLWIEKDHCILMFEIFIS